MNKILLSLLFFLFTAFVFPQNFFRGNFDKEKSYVILINPTIVNLETVNFLIKKRLLDIDDDRVNFVGVYHHKQNYDFSKTKYFIEKKLTGRFFLHEIRGDIPENFIFHENACTDEFRNIFSNSTGIIFFGGDDIPPSVYGEKNLYAGITDTIRHYFEISFLFHLLGGSRNSLFIPLMNENPCYLVTGFCLGMQTMNVAAGGSLYQDIPAQLYESYTDESILKTGRSNLHRNYWQNLSNDTTIMKANIHPVHFTENPFFGSILRLPKSMNPLIYSSHHQAVKETGSGLEVTALSPDGRVIEGIVHKKYPNVFSVQFHPEIPALYENREYMKFSPGDEPETLHKMLNGKSIRFHKKYWSHISRIIAINSLRNRND